MSIFKFDCIFCLKGTYNSWYKEKAKGNDGEKKVKLEQYRRAKERREYREG